MSLNFIKKNLLVFIVGVLVFAILLSFLLFSFFPKNPPPKSSGDKPESGVIYNIITEQDKTQLERDALVGKLIKKLPFQGKNVTLTYNSDRNLFTATFNPSSKTEGEQELIEFLKKNQIESTNWLFNYAVK